MEHVTQVALVRRIFEYLDRHATTMADAVHLEPVTAYADPGQAALEQQRLFREHPLVLGLSCEVVRPGDFFTHDLTGVPILVVRAPSGRLRAFLNVCRHRGAKVAAGSGCGRSSFACPYHAWTYDCDGRLIGLGTRRGFEGLDREAHGLTPLPAVEKHGLIWVRPTPGQPFDPDGLLEGLGSDFAAYGWAGYHHHATRLVHRRMNWKLAVDTFLESWHVPVLHRRTVATVLHGGVGAVDQFGQNLRLVFPLRSIDELRGKPERDWNLVQRALIIHVIFPNTILVMASDHLESWRIFPADERPGESLLQVSLYVPEPASLAADQAEWDRRLALLLATVDDEDFPVAEGIQRGFVAGAQAHVTFGRHEPALAHFHRAIARELRVGTAGSAASAWLDEARATVRWRPV
jgi:phenylpropionate dioxygenase-like ring-hydroxylating dioxygenase large terminal subunit